jgi:hypothetical protein
LYPQRHLLVTLIIATASLLFAQKTPFLTVRLFGYDFAVFVLCMTFGVLLDVDHIIDFALNRGRSFENLESRFKSGRMYVLFHGIENVVLFIVLAAIWPFLTFPAISYTCHMAMDVYGNGVQFRAYSYAVRFGRRLLQSRHHTLS